MRKAADECLPLSGRFPKVIWVKPVLSGLIISCFSFKNVFSLIDTGGVIYVISIIIPRFL